MTQAFTSVLEEMSTLEHDNPLAKSHAAQLAAAAVSNGIINIAELASPLAAGFLYPLFLLCLQQLAKLKDKDWLVRAFQCSKVNLQSMLPGTCHVDIDWTPHKGKLINLKVHGSIERKFYVFFLYTFTDIDSMSTFCLNSN